MKKLLLLFVGILVLVGCVSTQSSIMKTMPARCDP